MGMVSEEVIWVCLLIFVLVKIGKCGAQSRTDSHKVPCVCTENQTQLRKLARTFKNAPKVEEK